MSTENLRRMFFPDLGSARILGNSVVFPKILSGKGFVHQNNRVESVAQVVWHRIYSIKRSVALIKFRYFCAAPILGE